MDELNANIDLSRGNVEANARGYVGIMGLVAIAGIVALSFTKVFSSFLF
jgi:hypothetical protein